MMDSWQSYFEQDLLLRAIKGCLPFMSETGRGSEIRGDAFWTLAWPPILLSCLRRGIDIVIFIFISSIFLDYWFEIDVILTVLQNVFTCNYTFAFRNT